ncbi:hypothetical protein S14_64 [Shewanella sp. phage 1/4]|uniref:hypothetical protein n=1 Tax=Shewanella phage 1/4 TaxID=1458859 RepID=UPI0004F92251|nr:hypothetical protein S14_64 [Shewanella sp. phage 1/4]AHK11176.1 hypothetical protein S14_64 [Shewanella sp. phage 1/4]
MHKIELTELERVGLVNHGLAVGTPSQLSDCFRFGMKWAQKNDNKEFNEGVIWALARLIEMYDQPNMALEILNQSDIVDEDMKGLCEYDLAFLRGHDSSIPKGEK